ncbi:SDR family oxidoreductase [Pseudomonas sp. B21-040]|uniref:UDP-glucose 4-epimerase family protein n=1 Tax=Pseudomonas sp. B21-040 TaxID=2895486 RepID=UPI00215E7144|nr:SDR family oxidoreductase [Pseudomonas sp. B21-040]UVL38915.1 SDR family oxidoreductase [Pseudomonas sp. B21-040]
MKRTKILVTGASGLVGSALVTSLAKFSGYDVFAAVRSNGVTFPPNITTRTVGDLRSGTSYRGALADVDVIVHAAARVHVMSDQESDPLAMFRLVNVAGTVNLALQAADCGVKRFIFLSSIKVNGESGGSTPFTPEDPPAPSDPYGISKFEAESALLKISEETGMEVVIIRPPLVYGPGVKANFLSMMNWLNRGYPLPFGAIFNQRSFVAIYNLVDLIQVCLEHSNAANEIFLVSDGKDLSTTELLRHLGRSLGKPARLVPVPVWLMKPVLVLLRKRSLSVRLFDSLQVDISKTQKLLRWSPPVDVDKALELTAEHFLRGNK